MTEVSKSDSVLHLHAFTFIWSFPCKRDFTSVNISYTHLSAILGFSGGDIKEKNFKYLSFNKDFLNQYKLPNTAKDSSGFQNSQYS